MHGAALKITQTRINAIALAHRVLQEVDAQTVVNLRTLLNELAALLHDAFAEGVEGQPRSSGHLPSTSRPTLPCPCHSGSSSSLPKSTEPPSNAAPP